jgi:hypothetical protein
MPLFEVAVVLMPTKKGVEDGTEQGGKTFLGSSLP